MTTADPRATARRRRARKVRQAKHDAKVFLLGLIIGMLAFAMLAMSAGSLGHSPTVPTTTPAVVSK